jgi:general secretion pathway protein J
MFEALVAIALMALVLGALANVTAQWLPNWNRGLVQTQRNEQAAIGLDRLAADLSAAEFVTPDRTSNTALFRGDEAEVTFVRSALGPNNRPGLEIVRIAEVTDPHGRTLVRTRAPFILLSTGDPSLDPIQFGDPVVLLRAPLRAAFAYTGPRGGWIGSWPSWAGLPAAVRLEVRDAERGLVLATAVAVRAEIGAPQPEQVNGALPVEPRAQTNTEAR